LKVTIPASQTDKLSTDALFSLGAFKSLVGWTIQENIPLIEAFFLATTVHVLLLPVIWCMGWALPWPKSPVVTSVIEIDLQSWPHVGKAKKLYEYRDPKLNE
jgi:hypothetical protein